MGARYTTSIVITCIARTCDGCWCAPRETPNPTRRKRPSTVVHSRLSWNKNYVSMLTVTLKYVGERTECTYPQTMIFGRVGLGITFDILSETICEGATTGDHTTSIMLAAIISSINVLLIAVVK